MKEKRRKGKEGIIEKKCSVCGEWKPETSQYFYVTKKTGKFRPECKVCTAPFQKYRVESKKEEKSMKTKEKSMDQKPKGIKETKKTHILQKRHTYKMDPDTIERIDIISNVSGMEKGEIITEAINFFIDNNKKYQLMISQYQKLISKFRE
jgi:predicted DNA-binding protein